MSWWTDRQGKDPFVKNRIKNNYISRAYFKIEEIQRKYQVFQKEDIILDLGASPGGWSQFLIKITPKIFAIDILDTFSVKGVDFVAGDIYDDNIIRNLPKMNVICSDMAPNFSGNMFVDHMKTIHLCQRALDICFTKLYRGGNFITKIFLGEDFDLFVATCKKYFKFVSCFKPSSSRTESKEMFIVAINFIGK